MRSDVLTIRPKSAAIEAVAYQGRCSVLSAPPPRRLGTSPVQRAEGGKQVLLSLGRGPEEMGRGTGARGGLRTVIGR